MSSYVASRMASREAEKMLAPLLTSDDDYSTASDTDSDESSIETVKQTPTQKLKSIAVYAGLGIGVVVSAAAMATVGSVAIFIMGGVVFLNAPFSAIKERQLAKFPGGGLRQLNNKLREDANTLEDDVNLLSEQIDFLEPEAERAAVVEEQLRGIADQQGTNVSRLVELVKENEEILAQMKNNLRQRITQDMICIIMRSDTDGDHIIDKKEARILALRIRLALQEYGVDFDSDKFMAVIAKDPSVNGVIGIVEKLLHQKGNDEKGDEDSEEEDEEIDPMYDMFHMSSVSGKELGASVSLMSSERASRRRSSANIMKRASISHRRKSTMTGSRESGMRRMSTLASQLHEYDSDDSSDYDGSNSSNDSEA